MSAIPLLTGDINMPKAYPQKKSKRRDTNIAIPAKLQADVAHYTKLVGLGPALTLLMSRAKHADKLTRKREKDSREKQAASKPDGRLNAFNLASGSLVDRMGGKRKPKKTKRGY